MIFLTSFSGNRSRILLLAVPLFAFACATVRAPGESADSAKDRTASFVVESLLPDRGSPQAAEMTTVSWTASSSGGVGVPSYTFHLFDGTSEKTVQEGPSPSWSWSPAVAGTYRVRVVARDTLGNVAERAWAVDYEVSPAFERDSAVAVMPIENLTGAVAPIGQIRAEWIRTLKARGVRVLEDGVLEEFLTRHRIRYTGGLTKDLGEALRVETGAKGVLFTSLDLYDEMIPPRVALTARLVYAGKWTGILWMDSEAMMGDDSPGILGIGRIHDPRALREKVMDHLTGSLEEFLSGRNPRKTAGPLSEGEEKFWPKEFYRSPRASMKKNSPLVIAVLPFRDESRRRHIGEIMMLHFVRHLAQRENVEVVEPGVVRQVLITSRTIMEQGLSLPQADLLRELLGVDLVFAGWVKEYYDFRGPVGSPKVRFSAEVIDAKQRQVTWAALSYGKGDDWVIFFGAGKVNTAHVMASSMVREVVVKILTEEGDLRQTAGEE